MNYPEYPQIMAPRFMECYRGDPGSMSRAEAEAETTAEFDRVRQHFVESGHAYGPYAYLAKS